MKYNIKEIKDFIKLITEDSWKELENILYYD